MAFRLLHTGDWHLGARLGNQDRTDDQFERLDELCAHVDEHEVDLLLVAGDIFDEHRAEPLGRIINRLATLLRPRIAAGLSCVFLAGNHDREHVFPLLRGLQDLVTTGDESRVVFAQRPDLVPIPGRDGEEIRLLLLPYPTPTRYDLAAERWPSPDIKRAALADAVRERIKELTTQAKEAKNGKGPLVLAGHFLIRGVKAPVGDYQLTEQEDVIVERGDLPAFSYVALGHVHIPHQLAANIRYCGSLDRMDRGEAKDEKSVYLVEIDGKGKAKITGLPLNPTPFLHLEAGKAKDLEAAAAKLDEPERTLVSLTLQLKRQEDYGGRSALARKLFPRLYGPPEIVWPEQANGDRRKIRLDHSDVAGTVRRYLRDELQEDPDKKKLIELAEELLVETKVVDR